MICNVSRLGFESCTETGKSDQPCLAVIAAVEKSHLVSFITS